MAMATEAEVVQAWHAALNAGDLETLLSLSANDIEVAGPRGGGRGADVLRDWVGRANIRLDVERILGHGPLLVVEERARWAGDDAPQVVASVFRVQDGKVTSVIRHPDVAAALEAAGLPS